MNYTALGATVNLAARLEGLNKNYGTAILVSAGVKERAGANSVFRSVDASVPRALPKHSRFMSCDAKDADPDEVEFCHAWELVYAAMRNAPPAIAEVELGRFLANYPEDSIARYHKERNCRRVLTDRIEGAGAQGPTCSF